LVTQGKISRRMKKGTRGGVAGRLHGTGAVNGGWVEGKGARGNVHCNWGAKVGPPPDTEVGKGRAPTDKREGMGVLKNCSHGAAGTVTDRGKSLE